MGVNNRRIGTDHEKLLILYLEENGYEILETNYRCRFGEVDIIARQDGYLVFVEVKYRRNTGCGMPAEAVDFRKQKRISGTAIYYLSERRLGEVPVRFDVASVLGEEITLIQNAFDYIH